MITQQAPAALTLVRHQTQPAAARIAQLVTSAVLAYLVALLIPQAGQPVVAPLTAMLVVQASIYQTVRSAARRVASVIAGVLIALGLSEWMGLTWWSLGITITLALVAGYALRARDQIMEVPISAMLILSVGSQVAATQRVIESLIGAAAGLAIGFVLTRPQVQEAGDAVTELGTTMARLLYRMADGVGGELTADRARDWLAQARSLGGAIKRVSDALAVADESTRLKPSRIRLAASTVALRDGMETLEHAAIAVRVFARSLADATTLDGGDRPVSDPDVCLGLAAVLRELAGAVRTYGRLAASAETTEEERLRADLRRSVATARERENRLRGLLAASPPADPAAWPLRGEMFSHLDRLVGLFEAAGH